MRVLIIDDSVDTTFLLSRCLETCGHDIQATFDAHSAMAIAQSWRPDAVCLDIALPDEDGYVLARRLRTEAGLRDILIVATSGYVDDEARRVASGIDAHLLKPFSMRCLRDILTTWQSTGRLAN